MFQDDIKNKKTKSDFLKNSITSDSGNASSMMDLPSTENVADTLLKSDIVNNIAPINQIESGVKQTKSLIEDVQSMASLDSINMGKVTALKNNVLVDNPLSIQSVSKNKSTQQLQNTLSDMVTKSGLYFAIKVGELDVNTFDVVAFELNEGLSELYTLTLTLSSHDANIDLQSQLLQKTQFIIYSDGQKQRTINGIVESAVRGDQGFKRTYYTFVVRPSLWQLTLTQDSRIYHFKSVPEIIDGILREFNIAFDKQLMDSHSVREYTTMKRESYADFIFRLAGEEGISFWFEENQLFYSDSHLGMTAGLDLIYNPHPQSVTKEATINELTFGAFMRPTQANVKDYRYSHPDVGMDARSKSNQSLPLFEVYDSYGRYHDERTAKLFSQYRLDALRAESESGQAVSNSVQLMPGKIFQITEHPTDSMNDCWQIVRITHKGTLPQSLDNESDGSPANLTNYFTFIPGRNDWRPPFVHKPQADGDEVAMVVGPQGEEIYVNEDGAVKLHFHWNRYDNADENASCWVRVVQNWNGDGFGFLATPRIGQEVIVSYLNGDIDRPIITGTVYNGNNRPPLNLPAEKTRMSIRSKTHKGEGFNELRFEDENGEQEIFLHAEKNMHVKVKNSKHERVDFNRSASVGNNDELVIANDRIVTVEGHNNQKITGDNRMLTEGDLGVQVKGDLAHAINGVFSVSSNGDLTMQSDSKLTLRVGGSLVVVHAGGVDIKGPTINLNSGASPGELAIPANPAILKAAAGAGKLFVAHCPFKDAS